MVFYISSKSKCMLYVIHITVYVPYIQQYIAIVWFLHFHIYIVYVVHIKCLQLKISIKQQKHVIYALFHIDMGYRYMYIQYRDNFNLTRILCNIKYITYTWNTCKLSKQKKIFVFIKYMSNNSTKNMFIYNLNIVSLHVYSSRQLNPQGTILPTIVLYYYNIVNSLYSHCN